jgi:hypothetical protein
MKLEHVPTRIHLRTFYKLFLTLIIIGIWPVKRFDVNATIILQTAQQATATNHLISHWHTSSRHSLVIATGAKKTSSCSSQYGTFITCGHRY